MRVEDFIQINETVLRHIAIRGNVEAEIAADDSDAGCGCAYPDYVDEGVVARSNAIMARLRRTAMAFPELRHRLRDLPMTLSIEVGSERIAILHGDPESLAGWNFAVEAMPPGGATPVQRVEEYFRKAGARVFACTHTGLPMRSASSSTGGRAWSSTTARPECPTSPPRASAWSRESQRTSVSPRPAFTAVGSTGCGSTLCRCITITRCGGAAFSATGRTARPPTCPIMPDSSTARTSALTKRLGMVWLCTPVPDKDEQVRRACPEVRPLACLNPGFSLPAVP